MEQLGQNQSIETDHVQPPEVLEVKADADPGLVAYSSQPENNPLSQAFMEKYGVEYSDPQALAENQDKPSPEISVVIPVHNEGESIIGLLESLASQASDTSCHDTKCYNPSPSFVYIVISPGFSISQNKNIRCDLGHLMALEQLQSSTPIIL